MAHEIILSQEIFDKIKKQCMDVYKKGVQPELSGFIMSLMDIEGVPMHFPYHHFMLPAVLLTAASLQTGRSEEELDAMLDIAMARSQNILGGFCGNYGACGAGVGAGIFMSVFTDASPMSDETWQWSNEITGICLQKISGVPGPRCCKRTCFLSLEAAVPYICEKLGFVLDLSENIECKYHERNDECKKEECPFYPEA